MTSEETRLKILASIEQICASCLERIHHCPSELPSLTLGTATYRWNGKADDRDRRDFARYVYVLSVIHRLVRSNTRMNLRELFYSQVNLFHHQRTSDTIVEHIARQLAVERRQLGFVATAKGLFAGNVQYRNLRTGELIDGSQSSNGQLIVDEEIQIIESEHRVTFILVVEKDTVFQHLLNDGFSTRYSDACLITGRGQPDHATRSFLMRLSYLYTDTPMYILTDCDIYGVFIALTYQSTFSHQQNRLRWLGVWPEEIISSSGWNVSHTLPITDERERRMIKRFAQRTDINDEWRRQIAFFDEHQRKMEIEAIYQNGSKSLIDDYLHDKLVGHRFL